MNIIIVGAGTAGWITATAIKRNNPNINVKLIHDPNVKTIGVGETLVWGFPRFFTKILGLTNHRDWMLESDAVYKTGVKYTNLGATDSTYYNMYCPDYTLDTVTSGEFDVDKTNDYLHSPSMRSGKSLLEIAAILLFNPKYSSYREEVKEFAAGLSETYYFSKYDKSIVDLNGKFLINPNCGYSFHFNSSKFSEVLGKVAGKPSGVVEVHGNISSVNVEDGFIKSLSVDNGETYTADLYIDCTGFRRELAKHLPFNWIDADDYSNNTAIVIQTEHDSTGRVGRSRSNTTHISGHNNGWCFTVPLNNRSGNGYVFNSRYADEEEIRKEHKEYLGLSDEEYKPNKLKWNPGYYKEAVVNNCMVAGLSAGFIDPFGANNLSLMSVILSEMILSNNLSNLSENKINLDQFAGVVNNHSLALWKHVEDRMEFTFRITSRTDTPYWIKMKSVGDASNVINKVIDYYKTKDKKIVYGANSMLHALLANIVRADYDLTLTDELDQETIDKFMQYFRDNKSRMQKLCESAVPIEEFYKHFNSNEFPVKDI